MQQLLVIRDFYAAATLDDSESHDSCHLRLSIYQIFTGALFIGDAIVNNSHLFELYLACTRADIDGKL